MRVFARIARSLGLAVMLVGLPGVAGAVTQPAISEASGGTHGSLLLQSGSGRVVTLSGAAANVFVANPKVAEVRPASPSSLFVFGVGAGRTTVAAMDSQGHVLAQYEVTVQPSSFAATETQAAIARLVPNSRVKAQAQQSGVMLTGTVRTPQDAAQAVAIAKGYLGGDGSVDNEIEVTNPVQVTLSVRVAEMSRTVVRKLGINWAALGNIGRIGQFSPALALSASTSANGVTATCPTCLGAGFLGVIDALANDDLAQVLAEPNLTVMSGQKGSFQVGGEYPVPVSAQNGQVSVTYKNFGVILNFVPTVLSDGLINLHVVPEVSELTNQTSVQLANSGTSIVVPGLNVRRAETTVELGSGQSFAIAGLLQQDTTDSGSGVPVAGDIPVLGALFHDDQFQRSERELVIVVTPYIVRPVNNPADLHLPTDGYKPPTDIQRLLLMKQVATSKTPVPVQIPGDAGFMVQ